MTKPAMLFALLLISAACIAQAAHADTQLTYDGTDGEFVVSIQPGAMRIDQGNGSWQLYDQHSDTMFSVNPERKSYARLDKEKAQALQKRVAGLRSMLKSQLDKLPAQQREAARAALGEQLPGFVGKQQKTTLDYSGATGQIAGVQCKKATLKRDGDTVKQLCIASADALGLSKQEYATVTSMYALLRTIVQQTGFGTNILPYGKLDGVPVRLSGGSDGNSRELVKVAHPSLDDSLFRIPDGFTETTLQIPGQ